MIKAAAAELSCAASPLLDQPVSRTGSLLWSRSSSSQKAGSATRHMSSETRGSFLQRLNIQRATIPSHKSYIVPTETSTSVQFAGHPSDCWTPLSAAEQRAVAFRNLHVLKLDNFKTVLTVQPSSCSAAGPLRLQACRVLVWSVKSSSKSKPAEADRGWSLPEHSWLVQVCVSSVTWYLHLELRREHWTEQRQAG